MIELKQAAFGGGRVQKKTSAISFLIYHVYFISRYHQKFEHCNWSTRKQKDDCLSERLERVNNSLPTKAKRAVELAPEKDSSNWLTVIPLKQLDYNLNKKEFRDAIKLRYDWQIPDTPILSRSTRSMRTRRRGSMQKE